MTYIDLDRLADAYRLRPMSAHAHNRALAAAQGCGGWLLDIGGGAGLHGATWKQELTEHEVRPVIIDPSPAMLAQAGRITGLGLVMAEAQRLPMSDNTCGLAYFHMSIHYGEWPKAVDEALRVVAPGGRVEVWTIAPAAIERSSLGRWFPRVVEIDTARFPEPVDIAGHCVSRGGTVSVSSVTEPIVRRAGDWTEAVRGRFVSTLQLLGDEEIEAGLAEFAAEFPDEDAEYAYSMELTRISTVV